MRPDVETNMNCSHLSIECIMQMYRSEETCSYTSVPLFSHHICHDVFGKHCMQPDVVANMKCSHLSIDCMQIYSSKETFSYASSESLVELMKHIIIVT
jgi:hypothetical protein